jgi:hypothetical protein
LINRIIRALLCGAVAINVAFFVVIALPTPAYSVVVPHTAASTPNGRFIFVPDMTGHRIRVIDTNLVRGEVDITPEATSGNVNDAAIVNNFAVDGEPYCVVTNKAGTELFASVAQVGNGYSYIYAFSIGANGVLTQLVKYGLPDLWAMPRGCALTYSENYLYVTDYVATGSPSQKKVRRIAITRSAGTVTSMVQDGFIPITISSMSPYGVAISPNGTKMYVSNNVSAGSVLVYNIATENSPVYVTNITGLVYPTIMTFSPDSSKLYVRVLEKVSPFSDVKVYNTTTDTLISNVMIPSPGNHVTGLDSNSDGYSDDTNNRDENRTNYDAGLALSADGSQLFYVHYTKSPTSANVNDQLGVSGDGMWHWNTKIRVHDTTNLTTSWEGNEGRGFHSADSMLITPKRIWTFYSDGGYVQATQLLGPTWVSHYNPASNEATIIWPATTDILKYQVMVQKVSTGTVATYDVSSLSTFLTLEGLDKMSTYEVRIRVESTYGEYSAWSPNAYTPAHHFYTLETPWVDSYSKSGTQEYILFGPTISTGTSEIPYAARYDLDYRVQGTGSYTRISVPLQSFAATGSAESYLLQNLISGTTYEVRMRAVDTTTGTGEWSVTKTFTAGASIGGGGGGTWIGAYSITSHEAVVNWGSVESSTAYIIAYKIKTNPTWNYVTAEGLLPKKPGNTDPNPNRYFTGLTQLTTYEFKVKNLVYAAGVTTEGNWSNTLEVYTLERPWVDFYNPDIHSIVVTWGPEVSTNEINVPLSASYQMQYRTSEATGWQNSGLTLNNSSFYDAANPKHTALLSGLVTGATVEVRMRTVDGTGGASKWGYIGGGEDADHVTYIQTIDPLSPYGNGGLPITLRAPWWLNVSNVTLEGATLGSDPTPKATSGFIRYEYDYGTDTLASNIRQLSSTATIENTRDTLAHYTQHYAKVRAFYNDGGVTKASNWSPIKPFITDPFMMGPIWNSVYKITSHEAVVNWGSVETSTAYIIAYKPVISATWNYATAEGQFPQYNTLDTNPNRYMTSLNSMTTYEVMVKALRYSAGVTTESNWSAASTFYTLERPWVDFYNPSNNSAYIVWGPEVNTSSMTIPLALSYEMQYLTSESIGWQASGLTLNNTSHDDTTNMIKLNKLFSGLIAGITYEVRVRSIDTTGGHSLWGYIGGDANSGFMTIRAPWWSDVYNVTSTDAVVIWDSTPETLANFVRYEYSYGTNTTADNITPTPVNTSEASKHITGLFDGNIYYAKARAVYTYGTSSWSPTISFYAMTGPSWIANYNTTTQETDLAWEDVTSIGLGVTSYEVSYGIRPADNTKILALNPATATSSHETGLAARTWYRSHVRAHRGSNASIWSAYNDFFTIPAPGYLVVTNTTATTVTMQFGTVELAPGVPCTSYEVRYGTDESHMTSYLITSEGTFKLTLPTGIPYVVQVRSTDPVNNGYSVWIPYPPLPVVASDHAVITNITPAAGYRGQTVKIVGANFGSTQGVITFESGATRAMVQPAYWIDTEVAFTVPPTALAGVNTVYLYSPTKNETVTTSFTVSYASYVIDDIEGGMWNYSVADTGGTVYYGANSDPTIPEGTAYLTAEVAGTGTYAMVGGITPYGNDVTENGIDLTGYNKIYLSFRGDGSSKTATLELVEANTASGNTASQSEIWAYKVPISLSDTGWQTIVISATTEGAASFELTSDYTGGNQALNWNRIKSYRIKTDGTAKKYAIDYVYATYEAPVSIVTDEVIERVADTVGSGIRLSWSYIGNTSNVDIYTLDGTFETTTSHYVLKASNIGGTSWIDTDYHVGDGNIRWYIVVKTGTPITNAMISNGVLGKFDIYLAQGSSLISLPFVPANTGINQVIGNQLTGGNPFGGTPDNIQTLTDGVLSSSYLNLSGVWITTQMASIEPDRGYYVNINYANPTRTITLVGKTTSVSRNVKLMGSSSIANYVGTCYPIAESLNSSNLAMYLAGALPFDPNADYVQESVGGVISTAYKDISTGLFKSLNLKNFVPGRGYIIHKHAAGDAYWNYVKSY